MVLCRSAPDYNGKTRKELAACSATLSSTTSHAPVDQPPHPERPFDQMFVMIDPLQATALMTSRRIPTATRCPCTW